MACVCNHGSSTSHHRCSAPLQFTGPASPPQQPIHVHHCETEPVLPTYYTSPTIPQCTCCNQPPSNSPASHPTMTLNWSPSTSSHPPTSHHPHTSHPPHTSTSHHPHTSHPPHTPTSHRPHTSHPPHTPTSHHPHTSHLPHAPTSHHPHHTPTSHLPSSQHTTFHSPHTIPIPQSPTYHDRISYHPSPPHHHPPTHIHRAPYVASPLHHSHTYHQKPSPGFHAPHHGMETHLPPPSGCCTGAPCPVLPLQHPKSVCQVHPTRRQLIPAGQPCLEGSMEAHSPPPAQFVDDPTSPCPVFHPSDHPTVRSPLSSYAQPLPLDLEDQPTGVEINPHTPEYQARVGGTERQDPTEHVYSTPPPIPHNSRLQLHSQLEFSPYDGAGISNGFQTNFQLAQTAPVSCATDNSIPVQIPEPITHQQQAVPSTSSTTLPDPPPLPPPHSTTTTPPPRTNPSVTSSPLSSRANQGSESLPSVAASVNSPQKMLKKETEIIGISTSSGAAIVGSAPLVKTSFSHIDEKLGREAVVLEHCSGGGWKVDAPLETEGPVSWHEFEKENVKRKKLPMMSGGGRVKTETVVELSSTETEGTDAECNDNNNKATQGGTAGRGRMRMTRSWAKLVSDSELSHSEGEPVSTVGTERMKRSQKKRRGRKGNSPSSSGGVGERDGDSCVADSEDDNSNLTLVTVKTETRSPISTRTRSRTTQTDSSQSDSDLPTASNGVLCLRRRHRMMKGSLFAVESSQSESEPTIITGTQQQKQKPTKGKRKQQTSKQLPSKLSSNLETASVEDTPNSANNVPISVEDVPGSEQDIPISVVDVPSSVVDVPSSNAPKQQSMVMEGVSSVNLTNWYIRIVGKNLVTVEGIRNDNKKRTWHSGPIVKRLSPRVVTTRSGTTYHLEGPLDRRVLEKLKIGELFAQFEDGFPENWLVIIHEYLLKKVISNKAKKTVGSMEEVEGGRNEGEVEGGRNEGEVEGGENEGEVERERNEGEVEGGRNKGEVEGGKNEGEEQGESDSSVAVRKRTSKRVGRQRKQPVVEESESDECDDVEGEGEDVERRGGVTGLTVNSTPNMMLQPMTSEAGDNELTTQFKKEEPDEEEEKEVLTTPNTTALDTDAGSAFISSLKRSSRGRMLKPASFSLAANTSMNIYSYDMRGNFIGLASPVIDLTMCSSDTSGFLVNSGNESVILGRRVKQEPPSERGTAEEGEGIVVECRAGGDQETVRADARREREKKKVKRHKKDKIVQDLGKEEQKKHRRRKSRCVIPLALKKAKKPTAQGVEHEGEGEGDVGEDRTDSQLDEGGGGAAAAVSRGEEGEGCGGDVLLQNDQHEGNDATKKNRDSEIKKELETLSNKSSKQGAPADVLLQRDDVPFSSSAAKENDSELNDGMVSDQTEKGVPTEAEGMDSIRATQETGVDCLVGTMKNTTQDGRRPMTKVKVHHKAAKKRVSISNEVIVMGGRRGRRDGGRGDTGEEGGDKKEWSVTDLKKLSKVVLSVPALADNFWEVVAQRLGSGRSADECGREYAKIKDRRRKKKVSHGTKKKILQDTAPAPPLTAKVGTMKRKRQVRDILDHLDSGHTDDCFSSTPFKKSKLKNTMERDTEEEEGEEGGDCLLMTTPHEALKQRLGISASHTPTLCNFGTTPDFKGGKTQNTADHVIYKRQKAKKGPKKVPTSKKPASSKHKKSSLPRAHPQSSLQLSTHSSQLHSISGGELTVLRRFEDSDDSCDSNPFSDMEDACQDVIARLH